jgi:hypothetical protein
LLFQHLIHVMPPTIVVIPDVILHGLLAPLPGCSHRRRTGR